MIGNIQLLTIVNKPVSSNCHVLFDTVTKHCILVDPGSEDGGYIDDYLIQIGLIPDYIILTHEHFDHIWGCDYLVKKYSVPIVCSENCAEAIVDGRTNLSLFYENSKAFACPPASIILEDCDYKLNWDTHIISFYPALGHSKGGIIFVLDNFLITGDTLIKDIKTVTKLKCGSKEKLAQSITQIACMKGRGLLVCAGHGDIFELDNYDLEKALK